MSSVNEVVREFLVESQENLARLDTELVALENGTSTQATLGGIFRTIHTLKGSAGFLGFQKLEQLTHVAEGLLSRLRDGKVAVSTDVVSALLSTVDAVRDMLRSIEFDAHDGERDDQPLIARLNDLCAAASPGSTHSQNRLFLEAAKRGPVITESVDLPAPYPPPVGTLPRATTLAPAPSPGAQAATQTTITLREDSSTGSSAATKVGDSTIRLDVVRLDKLMNLVSELVLARNQILQNAAVSPDARLASATRNLNLITSELQEAVMSVRMQPIGNIWGPLPRVARDLALSCGKRVRLELEGSETELDKTVIEAMKDPLTHLLRNAIDHGLEAPEARLAAGKPEEGRVLLAARHEGGQVHIEISDDGAGIDPARVKSRAVERGLVSSEYAEVMTDDSVLGLIFLPGFSTADRVSNVSGRGVGLDVVRSNVEKIGGAVDVISRPRVGTTIKMRIPLTLAIIRALIVRSGGERYAIPQTSMIELVRLEGERARSAIERIGGASVYRFRGKLLPLVDLERLLCGAAEREREVVNLVVLQAEGRQFGLIVDSIIDSQEIVVKPLARLLRGAPCLAGTTILGDGRIALIFDVLGLAERGRVVGRGLPNPTPEIAASNSTKDEGQERLVLARGPRGERLAVPLAAVTRLEKFPARDIEWSGSQPVVQYRGSILSLIDLFGQLPEPDASSPAGAAQLVQVVVCSEGAKTAGLVVDGIVDVVSEPLVARRDAGREHVLCTAIVQQQVTDLLDVPGLLAGKPAPRWRREGRA